MDELVDMGMLVKHLLKEQVKSDKVVAVELLKQVLVVQQFIILEKVVMVSNGSTMMQLVHLVNGYQVVAVVEAMF